MFNNMKISRSYRKYKTLWFFVNIQHYMRNSLCNASKRIQKNKMIPRNSTKFNKHYLHIKISTYCKQTKKFLLCIRNIRKMWNFAWHKIWENWYAYYIREYFIPESLCDFYDSICFVHMRKMKIRYCMLFFY